MNPSAFTQAAELAASRYQVVLQAMRSLLFNSMAAPFSQRSAQELRANAISIGETYFRTERDIVEQGLRTAATDSIKTAQTDIAVSTTSTLSDVQEALLEQSVDYLLTAIRAQLLRDVETLVQRYREFSIEAQIGAYAAGHTGSNVRLGYDQDRVRFYFTDRAGRLYPSQKHIRTVWRQTLVTLSAEFYLLEAAERGCKACLVEHPDPDSRWAGFEISLTGSRDASSFIDVRDDIFHPNSNSILKAVI